MQYPNIISAKFVSRENRFVATVLLQEKEIRVHVKNTGRCRELLKPGATVYLVHSDHTYRKYAYDLVAVEKNGMMVNMDSQAANVVFGEYLTSGAFANGISAIKPEYTYNNSRIDFYFERSGEKCLVEVKGVTLETDGICRFPDAPTLRGTKHLRELIVAVSEGFQAYICFVVQMGGMKWLEPNELTDPEFAKTLRQAAAAGVQVKAYVCRVTPDKLEICEELPVRL